MAVGSRRRREKFLHFARRAGDEGGERVIGFRFASDHLFLRTSSSVFSLCVCVCVFPDTGKTCHGRDHSQRRACRQKETSGCDLLLKAALT